MDAILIFYHYILTWKYITNAIISVATLVVEMIMSISTSKMYLCLTRLRNFLISIADAQQHLSPVLLGSEPLLQCSQSSLQNWDFGTVIVFLFCIKKISVRVDLLKFKLRLKCFDSLNATELIFQQ